MRAVIVALVAGIVAVTCAQAHDMAAMTDVERDAWYRSLLVPPGAEHGGYSCCDLKDAAHIDLDHVRQRGGQWFVDLGKGFVPVPPDRVVTAQKSIDGDAYLFMMSEPSPDSPNGIRCFVPPIPGF